MSLKTNTKLLFILCVLITSSSCIDRGSPFFKKISEHEDKRVTNKAKRLIEENKYLAELHRECSSFPLVENVEPISISLNRDSDRFFYYYDFDLNDDFFWNKIVQEAENKGWKFDGKKTELWEEVYEFSRDMLKISISHGNFGRANIGIYCRSK